MSSKVCSKCGIAKPILEFHKQKDTKDGHRSICKIYCLNYIKNYRTIHPFQNRNGHLRNKFGITHQDYLDMLEAQNGRCKVCGTDTPKGNGAFHVDHCHSSGKIRGLLCHHCNVGLGNFKDNTSLLLKAILYLNEHHVDAAPGHKSDANWHRPSPRCFPGYCKS